jgi:hypothetical protein
LNDRLAGGRGWREERSGEDAQQNDRDHCARGTGHHARGASFVIDHLPNPTPRHQALRGSRVYVCNVRSGAMLMRANKFVKILSEDI